MDMFTLVASIELDWILDNPIWLIESFVMAEYYFWCANGFDRSSNLWLTRRADSDFRLKVWIFTQFLPFSDSDESFDPFLTHSHHMCGMILLGIRLLLQTRLTCSTRLWVFQQIESFQHHKSEATFAALNSIITTVQDFTVKHAVCQLRRDASAFFVCSGFACVPIRRPLKVKHRTTSCWSHLECCHRCRLARWLTGKAQPTINISIQFSASWAGSVCTQRACIVLVAGASERMKGDCIQYVCCKCTKRTDTC